jgi:hypothetical protein
MIEKSSDLHVYSHTTETSQKISDMYNVCYFFFVILSLPQVFPHTENLCPTNIQPIFFG